MSPLVRKLERDLPVEASGESLVAAGGGWPARTE